MTSELEIITDGDILQSSLSPTIGTGRPNFKFNALANNGKIWLAGSIDTLRTKTIYTYPAVMDILNAYYDYGTVATSVNGSISNIESYYGTSNQDTNVQLDTLKGVVLDANLNRKTLLSQASATFKYLKDNAPTIIIDRIPRKIPPTSYTLRTLHTLAKSTDGLSWTLIESNPFQPEVRANSGFQPDISKAGIVNGIAWNSALSLWVAVGSRGAQRWNRTQYGGDHSTTSSLTVGKINTTYKNYVYKVEDEIPYATMSSSDITIIATSPDAENWTQHAVGISSANGVACSSTLTIVVGSTNVNTTKFRTVLKSSDCKSWQPVNLSVSDSVGLIAGYGVAYNGNLWVVVGRSTVGNYLTSSIYTSTDGTTWVNRSIPSIPYHGSTDDNSYNPSFRLKSVAWNGSVWLTVGTNRSVYISEDGGYVWSLLDKQSFNGNNTDIDSQIYEFDSVAWDGNFWIITGLYGTYRSQDTIVWEKVRGSGGKSIATTIPLPILGGTIQTTNSIIVGKGSPSSLFRSNDDSKWYPQIFDVLKTNYIGNRQKEFFDVVWTGTHWIVVGDPDDGNFRNNIARSSNGTDWTFPQNSLTKCRGISFDGQSLVVVGPKSFQTPYTDAKSTDGGQTWTSGNLNTVLRSEVNCVANNGSLWIAGGFRQFATSTDGSNWTLANLCPLDEVLSIAWNGYIWIAVGSGKSHSIALSTNGTYWYIANPKTNFFKRVNGIAWNRTQWIAVGESDTDTMATSVDGYTWTGLGNTTFGVSGTSIAWTGSNWLASGNGYYPIATSSDGKTWTRSDFPIANFNKYANKTIQLPYTGVSSLTVLSSVNSGSTIVSTSTSSTIAAEEAAIKLAADQAAAAAAAAVEAASRLASKNSAAQYRMKILFWKKKLYDQITQLTNKTFIDLSQEHPVEFILANSIYEKIVVYSTEGQYYYEKVASLDSSLDIVSANLARLEAFNSTLTTDLLQFYNNARYLFEKILDAKYSKYIVDSNIESLIEGYNYPTNTVLNLYNSDKTTLDSDRSSANTIFDTEITSISYNINIGPTYLYDKDITDTITINNTTSTIYSNITTNAPDLYTTYTSVEFGLIPYLITLFNRNNTYKEQADQYVSDATDAATKWASVMSTTVPSSQINSSFATLYNKYFYIEELPYYYEAWSGSGGNVDATNRSIKYFKIVFEDYGHPSQYSPQLSTLYTQLKEKLDSIETTRITAINYAKNLRNTTVKTKLTEFLNTTKTAYTNALGIDDHIQTLCNLTYYSNSNFIRAFNFAKLVKVASKVYTQLYPFIRAVKFADAEAEDDGCIPPSTGWGSSLADLPNSERGKQGLNGWTKFNETYYARQRLTDHIRSHNVNGFVSYIVDGETVGEDVPWKDFLNFTETFTYDKLKDSIDDLTDTVDTIEADSLFLEDTMDDIATEDVSDIQSQVIPVANSYLSGLLTSTTEKLPSDNDLVSFGSVSINGSASLSSMVSTINTTYDDLTTAATTSLTGKTNLQIKAIVESAVGYKNTIDGIQTSDAYLTILSGIESYKINLQSATDYVEIMEEEIARWARMKASAIQNTPYPVERLSDGNGNPFIAGISPADSNYWTQRTYTSFYNPATETTQECTFSDGNIQTIDPLDYTKFVQYSSTTSYNIYDMVRYNNKVYECIKDVSSEYLENALLNLSKYDDASALFIQGVFPTDTSRWKKRRYPYVNFNGVQIEADPSNIKSLNIEDYLPYTPSYVYNYGDVVRSGDNIYICINDIFNANRIKGIIPTNDNYWKELTYPLVVYNNVEIEASPTNLPALSLTNFEEYSATKTYYKGEFVKQNSKIYELVEFTTVDSVGKTVLSSIGSSPSVNANSRWVERTYPVVYVSGNKIEATPGTFLALNINNYSTYSDSTYYFIGNYVKYNSKIYLCTLKTRSALINVPVSNNEYWMKIKFPTVIYNEKLVELIPGAIPPLNVSEFDSFRQAKRYFAGDVVSHLGSLYECTSSIPYGIGVANILPTVSKYWKERKYPYVVVSNSEVEADPDSGLFVELNHLDFHRYNPGFLYNLGDMVAFEGNVYECTSVVPPIIEDTTIVNIVPTNTNYWTKLDYTLETTYNITHWYPTISYEVGKLVSYNGKIYICETRSLNNIPNESLANWREITETSTVPPKYNASTEYGIGSIVSYREIATDLPNNETHKMNFYYCSNTELNRPVSYTYDTLYTTDEVDENDDYTYQIKDGNWLNYTARYGDPDDDPFSTQLFAYKLRRRVAMEIEIPYGALKYNVFNFNSRFKIYFKNLLTEVDVKPSNATTLYNGLETRGTAVCTSFNTLESSPNMNIYKLISKAYQRITDFLTTTTLKIKQYAQKINDIKTQYFNNPGVQAKIYENPYKFMNPVAFAKSPPQKMFRDLGVGNIKEMESEVYSGNQMNYTYDSIKTYYASTNIIDTLQEKIGELVLQCKCIIGYGILYNMTKTSIAKMGARIPCLAEGWEPGNTPRLNVGYPAGLGSYININLPITDYDVFGLWGESEDAVGLTSVPRSGTILDLINNLMIASVSPPEYCLGPSPLLESLTYESSNPAIAALSSIAKGAVGLVAAGFRNFTDPWQLFGAIEFVGQVLTNDYNKKILTFIPEGKWPSFNERAQDIRAFKQLVNIEKASISQNKDEYDATTLSQFLETVGKLLRLNQYDLDELNGFDRPDYIVERKTVSTTFEFPQPPNPPPDYVPPKQPEPPVLKATESKANLAAERERLKSMQRNLEKRLQALSGGAPRPSKYYVSIPKAQKQVISATVSEKKYKFEVKGLDVAATNSRQVNRVIGGSGTFVPKNFKTIEAQGPTEIIVNQSAIDGATQERKLRRAEFKQAREEFLLKNAERKVVIAQIEDARLREIKMTSAIEEIDFKNALIEAENDALTSSYKKELASQQEYVESLLEKQALAEEKYQKSLKEYERKIKKFPDQITSLSTELSNNKLILTQIQNDVSDGKDILVVKRTTYETRLLSRPPMESLIKKMMPTYLLDQYNTIVNTTATLTDETAKRLRSIAKQALAPAASAAREAAAFIDNRPSLKPFSKFISLVGGVSSAARTPALVSAIGPLMEVAGIAVQAWQDGAFEQSERLVD